MGNVFWTSKRKQQLRTLFEQGKIDIEIAEIIGAASATAVLGQRYRMGLKLTTSPIHADKVYKHKEHNAYGSMHNIEYCGAQYELYKGKELIKCFRNRAAAIMSARERGKEHWIRDTLTGKPLAA